MTEIESFWEAWALSISSRLRPQAGNELRFVGSINDINGMPLSNVDIRIDERTDSNNEVDEIRWELQFRDQSFHDLFWMSGHVEIDNYVDSDNYDVVNQDDFSFSDVYDFHDITPEELSQLQADYPMMSGLQGFNWDDLVFVRESTRVNDPGTADENVEQRVNSLRMFQATGTGIILSTKGGGAVRVEEKPHTDEIIVYSSFVPDNTSVKFEDIIGSTAFTTIEANLLANHGDEINSVIPNFDDLTVCTANDNMVATNADGSVNYNGYYYVEEPEADGEVYWELTFLDQTGGRLLHVGG